MKTVDTIIVGLGLAGIAYSETLQAMGKSFHVFSDTSQAASLVAGGLYNPVILKRFTLAWQSGQQLQTALPFYAQLAKKLKEPLDFKAPIYRRFASIEEQNLWFHAADKPTLAPFLNTTLIENTNSGLDAPFKMGVVNGTGRVATKALISAYKQYLGSLNALSCETFSPEALVFNAQHLTYKGICAQRVVFAEGYGLRDNPFFNYLPLAGTKGEVLTLRIAGLTENAIVKSGVFIIPLGDDLYRVGSTYFWKDKTTGPTSSAKKFLLERLTRFMTLPYEVVAHAAGVRPTVSDRRPLVGVHPNHNKLYVLNGLGSRGVMIAPTAAKALAHFIYKGTPIAPEMDIVRFANLL